MPVDSCHQEQQREHDGKAATRLRPRRACGGNSLPRPPTTACTAASRCCTWWSGGSRAADPGFSIDRFANISGSTVDWNGLAQRSLQYTAAGCCGRSAPPCSAMKPKWACSGVESWVFRRPCLHVRVFVRSAVAAGQLQRFLFRRVSVNQAQKPLPRAVPGLCLAVRDHLPSRRFHGKVTCSRLKKQKCAV